MARVWHPRLADAILRCSQLEEQALAQEPSAHYHCGIFAKQIHSSGSRHFKADEFHKLVAEARPPSDQHLHEVIMEGRPCWLYFDLEFCKQSNPLSDPEHVMNNFIITWMHSPDPFWD